MHQSRWPVFGSHHYSLFGEKISLKAGMFLILITLKKIVYINLCFFLSKRNQIRPFLSSDCKAFYLDFFPKVFSWNTILVCVFLTSTSIYVSTRIYAYFLQAERVPADNIQNFEADHNFHKLSSLHLDSVMDRRYSHQFQ